MSALQPTLRDRVTKWLRRHPRAATAMATFVVALLVFGGIRSYRLAAERALMEGFWAEHAAITADVDRLEADLVALEQNRPGPGASDESRRRAELARAELRERIELRSNDARSIAVATLGLTRGQPDARLVQVLSTRLRRDLARARATGDFVRLKVLAETRLALLDQLRGEIEWPGEERAFLEQTVAEASAEIERRLRSQ